MLTLFLVVAALAGIGFIIWKNSSSTAPNPPMINTGKPDTSHGPNVGSNPPADNRPKAPSNPVNKDNPY